MAQFEERDAMPIPHLPLLDGSRKGSKAENSSLRQDQAYCADRARLMFACYRREDAASPEDYAAAITMILSEYPRVIVEYVTDPRTGIQSRLDFPPTVKQMRDCCEAEAKRIELMSKPWQKSRQHTGTPAQSGPGAWANLFVGSDVSAYAAVENYICGKDVDPREWRRGKAPNRDVNGIWIYAAVFFDRIRLRA
jgi:hypothetical protein